MQLQSMMVNGKIHSMGKISFRIRLESGKEVAGTGKVKDRRKVFGRDEVLVEVSSLEDLWLTEEKTSQI